MAINDLDGLRQHLQWAIELEHSTLPPYLCALYSIRPGVNPEAIEILRSLLVEEMLHMTLAANLLNAVGGAPKVDKPEILPQYPCFLPHSNRAFQVSLGRFSPETIQGLMQIEKPESEGAPPEDDSYETIAQFYEAIEQGLEQLCHELGPERVFTGDPARQVRASSFPYPGSGKVIGVTDLGSAQEALLEIVEQGEGFDHGSVWDGDTNMFHPERDEVGHYFRLEQILKGRRYERGDTPQNDPSGEQFVVDWDAVYPMHPNPRFDDYPEGSPVRVAMLAFNETYSSILGDLERAFNGEPDLLASSLGAMYVLRDQAIALMEMPSGQDGLSAGPSFEYVPPERRLASPSNDVMHITITPNGPYVVKGGVPLVRMRIIKTEMEESLAWTKEREYDTGDTYALCRCGGSSNKPFCDRTHLRNGFDGTESAAVDPIVERQVITEGGALRFKNDHSLCAKAGFCSDRLGKAVALVPESEDVRVRSHVIGVIEHCPSGALSCELRTQEEGGEDVLVPVEPDLPRSIAVTTGGPLWVRGGIPIERADGQPVEVRNRLTLCRCGQSQNKPFCDGSHLFFDILD